MQGCNIAEELQGDGQHITSNAKLANVRHQAMAGEQHRVRRPGAVKFEAFQFWEWDDYTCQVGLDGECERDVVEQETFEVGAFLKDA